MGKSYAIIRLQKCKGATVHAMQFHNDRMPGGHANPDIDPARRHLNYELCQHLDYVDEVEERIAKGYSGTRKIRKDAVKLVEGIVTASPDFFATATPEETREFFEDARKFVAERFGDDNLVHFTVHMDEATPHAHFGFTPLRDGKLSWKKFFPDKAAMGRFQDDFFNQVGKPRGLARGEKRGQGAPAARHKSVREYKREAARLEAEIDEQTARLESVRQQVGELEGEVARLEAEQMEPARGGFVEGAREIGRAYGARGSARELARAEQEAADEASSLDARIESFERENDRARARNLDLESRRDSLAERCERLRKRLGELRERIIDAIDRWGESTPFPPFLSDLTTHIILTLDRERLAKDYYIIEDDPLGYDLSTERSDMRRAAAAYAEPTAFTWENDKR